ncbi:MAG TPA: sugar isomerase [Anaerolineae bacterium]|nr:sugar isomerase [Anaerolineae bacterium]
MNLEREYALLAERLTERGVDVEAVKEALKAQRIETPSWGYGDSGTRFKVFPWPGAARNVFEKIADAAFVHRLTGVAPSVALHIPWDRPALSHALSEDFGELSRAVEGEAEGVDDWAGLKRYAEELGIQIGAINPNLFQDDVYRLGSVCHPDATVRRRAVDHMLECVEIMKATGSDILSLWFADGTNYAGQDSIRERKRRMEEALAEVYAALPEGSRMLIEYKFFEPAFYHTDVADWGMAAAFARKLGPQAQVLVDTGHHAPGTNVEQIVAFLLDEGLLGGFHFNSRKYADDDLIVGTVNPFELFCIFNELVAAEEADDPAVADCARNVAYMIDQSHNIEGKIEAMIVSVMNCQTAYAKALLVDRAALAERRAAGDVLGAHRVLMEAYETDVHPLLARVRVEMGLDPDPIAAFQASGYAEKVARERGTAAAGGSGYPGA